MTIESVLMFLLGLVTWNILQHLYRGAKMWREHRRREQIRHLHAWRRARIAGARLTYPTRRKNLNLEGVSPSIPYLGIDVPVFKERYKKHG